MDQADLAIKLAFKNRLMFRVPKGTYCSVLILKFLGISANLNDILDELGTIQDDPYYLYLS